VTNFVNVHDIECLLTHIAQAKKSSAPSSGGLCCDSIYSLHDLQRFWCEFNTVSLGSSQTRNQLGTPGGTRVCWDWPKCFELCPILLNCAREDNWLRAWFEHSNQRLFNDTYGIPAVILHLPIVSRLVLQLMPHSNVMRGENLLSVKYNTYGMPHTYCEKCAKPSFANENFARTWFLFLIFSRKVQNHEKFGPNFVPFVF